MANDTNEPTPSATTPAPTPGPWKYWHVPDSNHSFVIKDNGNLPYEIICSIEAVNRKMPAERTANAWLLAAAPELLLRCKMSLADAEAALANPIEVADYNWQSIADDLREVIAKAEGSA
jgi:hypothetical protein